MAPSWACRSIQFSCTTSIPTVRDSCFMCCWARPDRQSAASFFTSLATPAAQGCCAKRLLRFLIEALLTLYFGPGIVTLTGNLFAHHFVWILAGFGALVVGWLIRRRIKRDRTSVGFVGGQRPAPPSKQTADGDAY